MHTKSICIHMCACISTFNIQKMCLCCMYVLCGLAYLIYACFSVLLWDCRTTSRVLNNESKHGRGAKSHCSSLSLCTAFTLAEPDEWSLEKKLVHKGPRPCTHLHRHAPGYSLWYVVKYVPDHWGKRSSMNIYDRNIRIYCMSGMRRWEVHSVRQEEEAIWQDQ